MTSYAGVYHDLEQPINVDNHGVFFLNSAVRYENVSDGATHTMFVGEKITDVARDFGWMSGTRSTLRNTGTEINAALRQWRQARGPGGPIADPPADAANLVVGGFGSHHPGGASFAFGDGHVSFLSDSLQLEVFQQLAHRADGKLLRQPY